MRLNHSTVDVEGQLVIDSPDCLELDKPFD